MISGGENEKCERKKKSNKLSKNEYFRCNLGITAD